MKLSLIFSLGLAIFGGNIALADSTGLLGSSLDPTSGNDPWAMFQILMGVGSEIWYVIKVVLVLAGLIGLIFIVLGLQKIRSHALDSQSGGSHLKHGIILVILGGLLFGAPVLTMMTGYSLFGSAPAPVATESQVYCEVVYNEYNDNGNCIPLAPVAPATPTHIVVPATPATLNCGAGEILGPNGCQPCQTTDYSPGSSACPCGTDKFSGVISPGTNYPNCPVNPSCSQGSWDGSNCWYGPVSNEGYGGPILTYSGGAFYQGCPTQGHNFQGSYPISSSNFEEVGNQEYFFKTSDEQQAFTNFKNEVLPTCIWNS